MQIILRSTFFLNKEGNIFKHVQHRYLLENTQKLNLILNQQKKHKTFSQSNEFFSKKKREEIFGQEEFFF